LIFADEDLTLYPSLAESWESAEDGLSFTFVLREDVIFHDGTPFNAEAVKFNLDRVADPETGALYAFDDLGPYVSTDVVDEFTVTVNMDRPYGFFIRAMSLMEFGMLAPSVAEMDLEDVGRNPIATGPFTFKEWITQERITVVRNEDYAWGPSPPYSHSGPAFLDEINFLPLTDGPTRVAALEAGEVDAIVRTPGTEVERLESAGFKIVKGLQTGMPTGFYVNVNKWPTNDPAVREAINLGLNRQQVSDGFYAGQEAPGYCPLTPTTFAHWDCTNEIYFDPEEAEQVLMDAGWEKSGDFFEKDGETLVLDVFVFGSGGPIGEAFQAAIRAVGIDVNLEVLPFSEQHAVGFEGRHNLMVGRFDAPDPKILSFMFHSRNSGPTGFTWSHLTEEDPEKQAQLDEDLDAGDAEVDPEARSLIYEDIQKFLVEENMFVALKYDAMIIAMQENVEGWRMNDMGYQSRLYGVSFGG
jgi:peptide/nickel transport system substrate-binding protein